MALPTSRDETVVDAGPLAFSTINSLQDQVIGKRHGSVILQIPASAWETDSSSGAVFNSAGHWVLDAASSRIYCPITLPLGTTIDKIQVFGRDSAADSFTVLLQERDVTTGSQGDWGTVAAAIIAPNSKASGTTNGFTSVSWTSADTNMPTITAAGVFYFLKAQLVGAGTSIHIIGAELTIRKL